jgi:hypothetical protein
MVDAAIEATPAASALSEFGPALRRARGLPCDEAPEDLGMAVATNGIAAIGILLSEPGDEDTISFGERNPREALVRRPLECSLLDVAVGSGSMEMTKCLLDFHSAQPTRETLQQSFATGNPELIRVIRERLSEAEM